MEDGVHGLFYRPPALPPVTQELTILWESIFDPVLILFQAVEEQNVWEKTRKQKTATYRSVLNKVSYSNSSTLFFRLVSPFNGVSEKSNYFLCTLLNATFSH